MGPLFPRWSNTVFGLVAVLFLISPAVGLTALMLYVRTPWHSNEGFPVDQPVQFDHRHHVSDDGIDCRYCHTSVDKSPRAGIPPTAVCMSCHAQIWNQSPLLALIRTSFFTDVPVRWNRVHGMPDFVYFNHSAHVNKGVGCVSCHGRVDQMPQVLQVQALTMGFCLGCHREPAKNLRPLDQITSMTWKPEGDPEEFGKKLAAEYDVKSRVDCITCHR